MAVIPSVPAIAPTKIPTWAAYPGARALADNAGTIPTRENGSAAAPAPTCKDVRPSGATVATRPSAPACAANV